MGRAWQTLLSYEISGIYYAGWFRIFSKSKDFLCIEKKTRIFLVFWALKEEGFQLTGNAIFIIAVLG